MNNNVQMESNNTKQLKDKKKKIMNKKDAYRQKIIGYFDEIITDIYSRSHGSKHKADEQPLQKKDNNPIVTINGQNIMIHDQKKKLVSYLLNLLGLEKDFNMDNLKLMSLFNIYLSELDDKSFDNYFDEIKKKTDKTLLFSGHGGLNNNDLTILVPEDTYIITITDINKSIYSKHLFDLVKFFKSEKPILTDDKNNLSDEFKLLGNIINNIDSTANFKLHRPGSTISEMTLLFTINKEFKETIYQDNMYGYLMKSEDKINSLYFKKLGITNDQTAMHLNINYISLSGLVKLYGKGVYIIFACRHSTVNEMQAISNNENNIELRTKQTFENKIKIIKKHVDSTNIKTNSEKYKAIKEKITEITKELIRIRESYKEDNIKFYSRNFELSSKYFIDIYNNYFKFKKFMLNIFSCILYYQQLILNNNKLLDIGSKLELVKIYDYFYIINMYLSYNETYDFCKLINYLKVNKFNSSENQVDNEISKISREMVDIMIDNVIKSDFELKIHILNLIKGVDNILYQKILSKYNNIIYILLSEYIDKYFKSDNDYFLLDKGANINIEYACFNRGLFVKYMIDNTRDLKLGYNKMKDEINAYLGKIVKEYKLNYNTENYDLSVIYKLLLQKITSQMKNSTMKRLGTRRRTRRSKKKPVKSIDIKSFLSN